MSPPGTSQKATAPANSSAASPREATTAQSTPPAASINAMIVIPHLRAGGDSGKSTSIFP